MKNFNSAHPELQEGEIFFCNLLDGSGGLEDHRVGSVEDQFEQIVLQSKRLGKHAYTIHGDQIKREWMRARPVFVKKDELVETGRPIPD